MKKVLKSRIFIVIITLVIGVSGTLYATTKYSASDVSYNETTVEDALNYLYNNMNNKECKSGICTKGNIAKVGDYIKMTPTSTSYTISKDLTGYTSDQTINPSELNLWRIIKINENGTMEMVSEYVSSVNAYFKGKIGYLNLVGALNEIASQYENSKYTIDSRIMGYGGQTEYITDTSKFTTTAPWSSSTSDNSNEVLGGGDVMYKTDTNLVKETLGTLKTKNPSGTASPYWLGSRGYYYNSSTIYDWYGLVVNTVGGIATYSLFRYNSGWHSDARSYAIRPILTLKSGLTATGSGTSTDPWVLQ